MGALLDFRARALLAKAIKFLKPTFLVGYLGCGY